MTIQFLSRVAAVSVLLAGTFTWFDAGTAAQPAPVPQASAPAAAHGGPLLQQDFSAPNAWAGLSVSATPKGGLSVLGVSAAQKPAGTIDVADSTTPSGAILLSVPAAAASAAEKTRAWSASVNSGLLPVRTTETNLGKLTLSFDHSVSSVRPLTVQIESFDAQKKRTGGREAVVYPAAPDFYLRSALELSSMKAFGGGAFKPTDPFVRLSFKVDGPPQGAADKGPFLLRVDNVAYASPAFYVSPTGSDKNDGRTEKTAFANPQKAIDAAQPGDIVLLMDGTYQPLDVQDGVVKFRRGGTPAAWISLKNYPGHKPTLSSAGTWNAIRIGHRGTSAAPSTLPALAYLEIRGLHIRGNSDTAKEQYPQFLDQANPLTNGNGIGGSGGDETNTPHHVRFADNLVEYCSGAGMGTGDFDWVTIENNVVRNNCWWMIYAGSGISLLGTKNFDATENVYKMLVRNNAVSGNRCFQKWKSAKRISDGNGIIVDSNHDPKKNKSYRGRTLIQNNLVFNNGGSGIHAFKSHRVDITNNTAYHNGASPELNWGQIFVQLVDDANLVNNILVSRPGQPINSVGPDGGDQKSTNVVRENNIYFGGLAPKLTGSGDIITDPQFVRASTDFKTADFHVRAGSPAAKSGARFSFSPLLDLDNKPRPATPSRGTYEN